MFVRIIQVFQESSKWQNAQGNALEYRLLSLPFYLIIELHRTFDAGMEKRTRKAHGYLLMRKNLGPKALKAFKIITYRVLF